MSNKLIRVALMALLIGLGISAQAKEEFHGFVKDPYYLIKGGKEVPPKEFAKNPQKYMRSAVAYAVLLEHVSLVMGRPINDQAFRDLIVSDDVQIVRCDGRIKTDGITDGGKVGRHERACYPGEHLLQVKVPGGWMNLFSLGCYNPIEGERPPAPKPATAPTPVAGVCGSNARRYGFTDTGWPSDGNFCAVGEQSTPSILFPQAGSTSKWSCAGKNAGQVAHCEASRDAEPPQPAPRAQVPQPKCEWVNHRYILPQAGQFVSVPGLSVAVCRGQMPIPDIFVNIPGDVMTVTQRVRVCR